MKPSMILSQLEREPIVYFGCTWSEIMSAARAGLMMGLLLAITLGIMLSVVVDGPIPIVLAMLVLAISSAFITMIKLKKINSLRAGKPLFYERHATTAKSSSKFYQPMNLYQRERNRVTKKKN